MIIYPSDVLVPELLGGVLRPAGPGEQVAGHVPHAEVLVPTDVGAAAVRFVPKP